MHSGQAAATTPQTLLGFDLGLSRTGLAVGNTLTGSARPLTVFHANNKAKRQAAAMDAISEWKPNALIVGIPCHPDGKPHDMTRAAMNFARALHTASGLPVWLVDERYSSAIAGVETDADAAAVILQQYFDEGGVLLEMPAKPEPKAEPISETTSETKIAPNA